jgi:hypothetical protein
VGESEHESEEQVEDLDVPESEGEDVKGGAVDAFQKITPLADKQLGGNISQKVNPGGLNFQKW